MSEDRIEKAIDFLKNNKIKDVSYDEKLSYLKSKLTEEELSEAVNRVNKDKEKKSEEKAAPLTPSAASYSAPLIPSTASYSAPVSGAHHPLPPPPRSAGGSSLMNAVNIGAISAVSSIGISYLINSMKDKKEKEVFQCMKDFQEQSISSLQSKITELQEENARLKSQTLTEADVKMIVSKAMDTRMQKFDQDDGFSRRNSQNQNEPISLQIKSGKGRFLGGKPGNNNFRQSAGSNDSDDKKDPTTELCEGMNKFLKHEQENNSEVMREMRMMNKNMSSCFTTLSIALNKLSTTLGGNEGDKAKTIPPLPAIGSSQKSAFLSNTGSLATSSSIKGKQEEIKKEESRVDSLTNFLNDDKKDEKKEDKKDEKKEDKKEESQEDNKDPKEDTKEDTVQNKEADPKVEEEATPETGIDDVLKIGAEINKDPVVVEEEEKLENPIPPFSLDQVEPAIEKFQSSLSDLTPENKRHCISRLCSLFSTMKNNQAKGLFKINLSNKMFATLAEHKRDEFIELVTNIGFIEKGRDLYEAADIEVMKKILNDTKLIELLRNSLS